MSYWPSKRTLLVILLFAVAVWLYISFPPWQKVFEGLRKNGPLCIITGSFLRRLALGGMMILFILAAALIIYFLIALWINKLHKARMSKSVPSIPLSPEEDELYTAVLRPKLPESNLRRYYYRLGALLLCVLIVGAGSNLFFMKLKQARRQCQAAKEILNIGGKVAYDEQGDVTPDALPWLRKLLGNDFFDNVTSAAFPAAAADGDLACLENLPKVDTLDVSGTGVSNAGLASLEGLRQLVFLKLDQTKISDAGLEHLKGLSNLQELSLENTRITDDGLAYLAKLSKLQVLVLDQTPVTDAGLAQLKELKQLHTLSLQGTRVGNDCLNYLAALPHLQELDISKTAITSAGLWRLKEIPRLRSLTLGGFLITDDDLECIKDLPYLESLSLIHTLNSDAGLAHLKGLMNLETLKLRDTKVSDKGILELQEASPNLKITK